MYKSFYDLAVNFGLEPTPGFRKKLIKAHIVLDEAGNYQRISVSDSEEKTLCPDKPFQLKGFTGNSSAQFLIDYAIVVLYSSVLSKDKKDKDKEEKKYIPKHNNFVKQIQIGREEGVGILKPIADFFDQYDSDEIIRDKVLSELASSSIKISSDNISFRVGTKNVETDLSWLDWYKQKAGLSESKNETTGKYFSEVTGKDIVPISGKYPQLVGGKAGSGIPIFSSSMRGPGDSQLAATKSYGSELDCPMSESEANTIVSGLDFVLNEADQYNPDFGICWWYDSKIKNDVIKTMVSRWQKKETGKKVYQRFTGRSSGKQNKKQRV